MVFSRANVGLAVLGRILVGSGEDQALALGGVYHTAAVRPQWIGGLEVERIGRIEDARNCCLDKGEGRYIYCILRSM